MEKPESTLAEQVELSTTCPNCLELAHGMYCSHCGQKIISRFTGRYLWTSVRDELLSVDSHLWVTFKSLWSDPGKMILNYLNGATKKYYGPVKYLFFWTAVYLIVIQFTVTQSEVALKELVFNNHEILSLQSLEDFVTLWAHMAKTQTNIYFMMILPFLVVTTYLVYRRHKFNITEIFILLIYFYGQFTFVAILVSIVNSILDAQTYLGLQVTDLLLMVFYLYTFIKMSKAFFGESWRQTIIKSFIILNAGTICFWIFLFVIFNIVKVVAGATQM